MLGLSASSVPFISGDASSRTSTAVVDWVRSAIDQGINYLDAGYPYDLKRQQHIARSLGEALQDGYLQKTRISVTLPAHLIRETGGFEFFLNEQLRWLRIDKADFCLFGRLNRDNWPELQKCGALEWADRMLREGKIGAIGFSFHDHYQILRSILAAWDRWALCQMQFSYMDASHDPGIGGIQYAAGRGLAVVAAEPLKGGRLARTPPPSVARLWTGAGLERAFAEIALRFVWSFPGIATTLLDAQDSREIRNAARLADQADPEGLAIQEEILIGRVRDEYFKLSRIECSSCRPCMPCPEGIDVPRIFELYNDAFIYDDVETARAIFQSELHNIGLCTRCGCCEDRCVKAIPIIEWLDRARRLFMETGGCRP